MAAKKPKDKPQRWGNRNPKPLKGRGHSGHFLEEETCEELYDTRQRCGGGYRVIRLLIRGE